MKSLNRFLTIAGITVLVGSASAQDPTYSSKARLFRGAELEATPSPAIVTEVSAADISSKPWLHPAQAMEKEVVAVTINELKTVTAGTYNSKKAVRGEGGMEFEIAPLK